MQTTVNPTVTLYDESYAVVRFFSLQVSELSEGQFLGKYNKVLLPSFVSDSSLSEQHSTELKNVYCLDISCLLF